MTKQSLKNHLAQAEKDLVFKDDLTGLFNRRLLTHLFEEWWQDLVGANNSLALIMLDLDHFKEVNDTYGHLSGDEVLKATAEVLKHTFRSDDIVVRFGGDEFVVLLPGVPRSEAARLGDRARVALSSQAFTFFEQATGHIPVSFSIGVASVPDDGEAGVTILEKADRELYQDKHQRHSESTQNFIIKTPIRRRVIIAAGVVALMATAGIIAWQLESQKNVAVEPNISGTDGMVQAPPLSVSPREAALLAEVETLRSELNKLKGRSGGKTTATTLEDTSRMTELEDTIRRLEAKVAADRGDPNIEPTPTATPPLESTTPVPLTQTPNPTPVPTPERVIAVEATPVVVTTRPVLKTFVQPVYPNAARLFGREATVDLRVWVDATGCVTKAELTGRLAGLGFDEAARQAALLAIYEPGRRDGVPVPMETTLTVRFVLPK